MALMGSLLSKGRPFAVGSGKDVMQSNIMSIVLTRPGERVWRPEFGCMLRNRTFDPIGIGTVSTMQQDVMSALADYAPDVRVLAVDIQPNEERSAVFVSITWQPLDVIDDVNRVEFNVGLSSDSGG